MAFKLIFERDDMPYQYTRIERIEMTVDSDATKDDMCDVFEQFLKATGYSFNQGEHIGYEFEEDDEPLVFGNKDNIDLHDIGGVADSYYDVNPDLSGMMAQDSDTIINLSDHAMAQDSYSDYNITMDGDIDLDAGTITLDLSDRYGTTTTKLKDDK